MNFRIIPVALVAISALTLGGCGKNPEEEALKQAKLAAFEQTVANQAATSKQLVQTQVARNHLIDQVKGAKAVASTAVDRAHAKGVETGFGKPAQKKKS
jgi:hypothetical protein